MEALFAKLLAIHSPGPRPDGTIKIVSRGENGEAEYFYLRFTPSIVLSRENSPADVEIEVSRKTLEEIEKGTESPQSAFLRGDLVVTGRHSDALLFSSLLAQAIGA